MSVQPRPVHWMEVQLHSAPGISLAGIIEPSTQIKLGFRVLGRMVSREVSVGDSVSVGQTLAIVDPSSFELNVRAARSAVSNAEAQLTNVVAEESRLRALLETDVASKAMLEVAIQQLEAARAALTSAEANLSKAEERLGYTRIVSEFDGVVIETMAAVGETVAPGQTVLSIASLDEREAVVALPDTIAGDWSVGNVATIALEIDPSIWVNGVIREIAPEADSLSRTVRARVTLNGAMSEFRLGTTVIVSTTSPVPPTMVLPATALLRRESSNYVWVISPDDTFVTLQPVSVGEANESTVIIIDGLEVGSLIVVVGVNSLEVGQSVRLGEEVLF